MLGPRSRPTGQPRRAAVAPAAPKKTAPTVQRQQHHPKLTTTSELPSCDSSADSQATGSKSASRSSLASETTSSSNPNQSSNLISNVNTNSNSNSNSHSNLKSPSSAPARTGGNNKSTLPVASRVLAASKRPVASAVVPKVTSCKSSNSNSNGATPVAKTQTASAQASRLLSAGKSSVASLGRLSLNSKSPSKLSNSVRPTSNSSSSVSLLRTQAPSCSSLSSSCSSNFRQPLRPQVVGSTTSAIVSSAGSANKKTVPTLAMSLRDKDQQIKLLIKERDEQKFAAELQAQKAEEWREKFLQSELEKSHVTSEADDEVIELRRLAQELEDENKRLAEKLGISEQTQSDIQFKLHEAEIDKTQLIEQLEQKEEQLREMESEHREVIEGQKTVSQVQTERQMSKQKYEKEIEELKKQITGRDEQIMQLRSSLEMRKNEVNNLQKHSTDLERKLKIESERSERHLKRIDEVNLELKTAEDKLATKTESNEMHEKQVKQLRQELRAAEEKLEQVTLARKRDVDILHNKLSAARRGSAVSPSTSPQPFKTPTPQDEIVRLQMEIRDLKDQLIDREAELDCNRRDLEVIKRKMETRTLEVDCNNQELARRCQDLLEQNRQSEDTVKQLLKSTTEYSGQLMRATEDLKEANSKCLSLREEVNELERKLDEQIKLKLASGRENCELKDELIESRNHIGNLRLQVDSLNKQISELCEQLNSQTSSWHKDREALADQLSESEIHLAQLRQELERSRQDLRTGRLQIQEVANERDRLKTEISIKEKYISSRNDIIETLRSELDDSKRSLGDYKQRIEALRETTDGELDQLNREFHNQVNQLREECRLKGDELATLHTKYDQLTNEFKSFKQQNEEEELKKLDDMRHKHKIELDALNAKISELETKLEEAENRSPSTLKRQTKNSETRQSNSNLQVRFAEGVEIVVCDPETETDEEQSLPKLSNGNETNETGSGLRNSGSITSQKLSDAQREYESQIEFLNSVVVDMQQKCDDYKHRLAQVETMSMMNEFDQLILSGHKQDKLRAANSNGKNSDKNSTRIVQNSKSANKMPNGYTSVLHNATLTRPNNKDMRPSRISGRPYCDICNVYDIHHTIYCPKVSEKLASYHASNATLTGSNGTIEKNNNSEFIGDNLNNNNNEESKKGKEASKETTNGTISPNVDEMFREYEQSLQDVRQFSSLRRPVDKGARPYCNNCDLYGHQTKQCNLGRA